MKMTNQIIRTQQELIVQRVLALIGFILLTVTPALAQQTVQGTEDKATGWRKIVSYSSGFEALMPKAAKVNVGNARGKRHENVDADVSIRR